LIARATEKDRGRGTGRGRERGIKRRNGLVESVAPLLRLSLQTRKYWLLVRASRSLLESRISLI
jgi:hypothetical protein